MSGRLPVVGIGPGDPDLITRRAERLIRAAAVVAYHAGVRKESHARCIAADLIPAGAVEEELRYPVTTGTTEHPGGYVGALADFYAGLAGAMGMSPSIFNLVLLALGLMFLWGAVKALLRRSILGFLFWLFMTLLVLGGLVD